jgi:hypothetical protein
MDPVSLTSAVKLLIAVKKNLDSAALSRQMDEIGGIVGAIGQHLAESAMAELRAGFSHLEVALSVTDSELRNDELMAARQIFNRLANRSTKDGLLSMYGQLSAAHVSALGHLGNYFYFLARNQPNYALVSAYTCTETFPALGVSVLPVGLFSRDWRSCVPSVGSTPDDVHAQYRSAVIQHRMNRREYGLDMLWRVPAASGVFLAGLAGSAVSPSLAGWGVQHAMGLLASSENGLLPPPRPDKKHYLQVADEAQRRLEPVISDARQRREAAQALAR